jgi:hypothetical protein
MTPGNAASTDLDSLRQEFAGSGWAFGSLWASAATGPDARRLYASRDGMLLTSWTAAELRTRVQHEHANQ